MKPGSVVALVAMAAPCFADPAPGVASLVDASDAARPLELTIWYPSDSEANDEIGGNAVFSGASAAPNAPVPAGRLHLVVMSHGGLRSAADSGAWLGASLARVGFMAVEFNAPRPNNAATAVNEIWRRPRDISRAVDLILGDPAWARHVDQDRMSVLGFALGGTAALSVAGAAIDPELYLQSCSTGGPGAPDCGWYAAQNVALDQVDRRELARSGRDPRFGSAVALAPEYLAAFEGSAIPAAVPTLMIRLDKDMSRSDEGDGVRTVLIPEASRFDAFPVCTEAGPRILLEEGGDPALCGASSEIRTQVHDEIAGTIASFLADSGD